MKQRIRTWYASYPLGFWGLAILASFAAGFSGIVLHLLLDVVEKCLFGRSEVPGQVLSDSILPERRLLSLLGTGLLAGLVWFVLQARRPLYSVGEQLEEATLQAQHPPFWQHLCHSLWQVISVGAGSPIGKEGAPREMGALFAGRLAHWGKANRQQRRLLIACSAGAGLAAVYQIPLASSFFVLEVLGVSWSVTHFILALGMTSLAASFANLVVSNEALYVLQPLAHLESVWLIALLLAVGITPLAVLFKRASRWAEKHKPKDVRLLASLPLAFALLALASLAFPELMGNGSNLAQAAFNGMPLSYALASFAVKSLAVLLALWAGAYGGTLTPSFALGAVLGLIAAQFAAYLGWAVDLPSAMALGSVVFLGTTLQAPLAAIGIVMGFTGQPLQAMWPLGLAMLCSYLIRTQILERKK
ncbi:chloride channel protein [Streptococcus sp. DD12]|uniref:chloride channel protein n=1 Tax=Streptococcus sp. DD12 TaxID=1777880 RepID=UPI000797BB3D|nr:chloride channel protein [Streptococcus sp. DD12]KXT76953.1 Chloride channel protein [Streptococcus sp. DD12]